MVMFLPKLGHLLGRMQRRLPKVQTVDTGTMAARFFVPHFNHHMAGDLDELIAGRREPRLYEWIEAMPDGAVFFDIGTNYGQECVWAAGQKDKTIRIVGFDCSLLASHVCALNAALNDGQFDFVFAAVGAQSGDMVPVTTNSDTHIPRLHRKNAPYSYAVPSVALDDYCAQHAIAPTHMKIDVDGPEAGVVAGAAGLMGGDQLREIFIEIDHANADLAAHIESYGFARVWEQTKRFNTDYLFRR